MRALSSEIAADVFQSLPIDDLLSWLEVHGWKRVTDFARRDLLVLERADPDTENAIRRILPGSSDVVDYGERVRDILDATCMFDDLSLADVIDQVRLSEYNSLLIDVTNGSLLGVSTLSLRYLIDGVRALLMDCASSELRRSLAKTKAEFEARAFVDGCRVGRSRRGGNVVLISCPIGLGGLDQIGHERFGHVVLQLAMRALGEFARRPLQEVGDEWYGLVVRSIRSMVKTSLDTLLISAVASARTPFVDQPLPVELKLRALAEIVATMRIYRSVEVEREIVKVGGRQVEIDTRLGDADLAVSAKDDRLAASIEMTLAAAARIAPERTIPEGTVASSSASREIVARCFVVRVDAKGLGKARLGSVWFASHESDVGPLSEFHSSLDGDDLLSAMECYVRGSSAQLRVVVDSTGRVISAVYLGRLIGDSG